MIKNSLSNTDFFIYIFKENKKVQCGAAWLNVCIQDLTGIFSAALMVHNLANRMVCI